jgi:hypothetical protein
MAGPLILLLNASKVLAVGGFIVVSVDSIFYHKFRKENLLPFENPLNEDEEVLARFAIDKDGKIFFKILRSSCPRCSLISSSV